MKEISISDINGIQIGQAQDSEHGTGCTVILCKEGACAGVDVRGGGPATRESDLLDPKNMVQRIHGILLSGGSAYGLDAAAGAMQYLEEAGCGFAIAGYHVPIVCSASLFDLSVGDGHYRPDKQMGYDACKASERQCFTNGNFGAGCGASVGKFSFEGTPMKSGQGMYGLEANGLQVCAVVAVNAIGNIRDPKTGEELAGMLMNDEIVDPLSFFEAQAKENAPLPSGNTTIGCIVTNAKLDKSQCNKIASIAHNAYARAIHPVHTMSDGDTIFVLSTNEAEAMPDAVGVLAVEVMERAICKAVTSCTDAYGLLSAASLHRIRKERK